ncbi:hypothetical protein ACFYTS_13400 [Nocardia sp. NPDC004151]|uniref:hypothetical protein n=1 Tax=Nocardia sp. NPDC004151 TaxID=3364304 RepID=UPI003682EDE3
MTMRATDPGHEAELQAEKERLEVVQDMLSDILDAACTVKAGKSHLHCEAENDKIRHWATVHESVRRDRDAAADAYYDLRYGPKFVANVRVDRDRRRSR